MLACFHSRHKTTGGSSTRLSRDNTISSLPLLARTLRFLSRFLRTACLGLCFQDGSLAQAEVNMSIQSLVVGFQLLAADRAGVMPCHRHHPLLTRKTRS